MEQMAMLLLTEADLKLLLKAVRLVGGEYCKQSEDAQYESLEARLDSLHTKIFPKPKRKRAKKL